MMLTLKLALRTMARRRGRMALIGVLVAFGTFLIVFGTIFAGSARSASRASIIDNFTGDFVVYSARSKDLPSPFAFNTPLPRIRNEDAVEAALSAMPEVEAFAPYAQNYGMIQVDRGGKKVDMPLIFYAVEPRSYLNVFSPAGSPGSGFFGLAPDRGAQGGAAASGTAGDGAATDGTAASGAARDDEVRRGVMISGYQNDQYRSNYGVTLSPGDKITLLGVTEGGVNTVNSRLVGVFEPAHYTSVFNYINFMDASTYAGLYDYSGVQALPDAFNRGLEAAGNSESDIFGLAGNAAVSNLDLSSLKPEALSGATMIAVRLKDHASVDRVMARLAADASLGVKTARWDVASGFYAQIASGLQAFIWLATALVFLVVALIFMNTLIINVTERTAEIGTMRAIGGEKSFIRGLFLTEALVLNTGAALVGMAAAGAAVAGLGRRGLALPELVSQFLIGGGSLRLAASPAPFGIALVVVVVVSVLATIYPVRVATSITPLAAMSDR